MTVERPEILAEMRVLANNLLNLVDQLEWTLERLEAQDDQRDHA